MDMQDSDNYVLDVPSTVVSNMVPIAFLILISVFVIVGAQFIGTFDSEEAKLLGVLVWMFSVVRLMGWVQMPNLEYKPRT